VSDCPITGTAIVQRRDHGLPYWLRADPEIHIIQEVIDEADADGLAFLTAKYEIGEQCPHLQGCRHARLREPQ
jgi:hypothetical protein